MLLRYKSARVLLPALATVALAWGCSEMDLTGLDSFGDPIQFSHEITLGELEDALASQVARVDIQLLPEGMVARRVLVKPEGMEEAESIKDRITAINVTEGEFPTGTLTLSTGDLVVGFDIESRFAMKGEDGLSFGQFVERVVAALNDGLEPPVLVERHPPDAPQAPNDAEFFAIELTLLDGLEEPEFDINVDVWNQNEVCQSRHLGFYQFERYDLFRDLQLGLSEIFTAKWHLTATSPNPMWAVYTQHENRAAVAAQVWQHRDAGVAVRVVLPPIAGR